MTIIWIDFCFKAFKKRYISKGYIDRTKIEILELRQNDSPVADYKVQFERLSKYVSEEITTDELKQWRLKKGLNLEIWERVLEVIRI